MEKVMKRLIAISIVALVALQAPAFSYAEDSDSSGSIDSQNYVNERQNPDGSFLYDTSIDALAGADAYYDGATVVVTGEVVGDRINGELGSNSCWITLYSLPRSGTEVYKPSSIQVHVSNTLADTIDTYGRYGVQGSQVQVNGTFQLSCVEHQGTSDIHATSLTVVQKGSKDNSPIDLKSFLPGVITIAAGLLLALVYRHAKERGR